MQPPFFILGNPRSGTTIFRLMLNNHPLITVPPECGFALWYFDKHKDYSYSKTATENFLDDLYKAKKIENWKLDRASLADHIHELKPQTYAELVTAVYFFYAKSHGKSPVICGDKNNFYISYIRELKSLFPDTKILFLTRDGRDVATSYIALNKSNIKSDYLPKLPGKINEIAGEWVEKNQKIIDLCSSMNPDQSLHVRFEDLILDAENELKKVSNFLGLEYSDKMLDYHQDESEPADTLQWKQKVKQAPDQDNIGKYKQLLAPEQLSAFNEIAGDMLRRFKYA